MKFTSSDEAVAGPVRRFAKPLISGKERAAWIGEGDWRTAFAVVGETMDDKTMAMVSEAVDGETMDDKTMTMVSETVDDKAMAMVSETVDDKAMDDKTMVGEAVAGPMRHYRTRWQSG